MYHNSHHVFAGQAVANPISAFTSRGVKVNIIPLPCHGLTFHLKLEFLLCSSPLSSNNSYISKSVVSLCLLIILTSVIVTHHTHCQIYRINYYFEPAPLNTFDVVNSFTAFPFVETVFDKICRPILEEGRNVISIPSSNCR